MTQIQCFTCRMQIGSEFSAKKPMKEPYGDAVVCEFCHEELSRARLTAYQSLVREGTIRIPIQLPDRGPKRRGRRPRVIEAAAQHAA